MEKVGQEGGGFDEMEKKTSTRKNHIRLWVYHRGGVEETVSLARAKESISGRGETEKRERQEYGGEENVDQSFFLSNVYRRYNLGVGGEHGVEEGGALQNRPLVRKGV